MSLVLLEPSRLILVPLSLLGLGYALWMQWWFVVLVWIVLLAYDPGWSIFKMWRFVKHYSDSPSLAQRFDQIDADRINVILVDRKQRTIAEWNQLTNAYKTFGHYLLHFADRPMLPVARSAFDSQEDARCFEALIARRVQLKSRAWR